MKFLWTLNVFGLFFKSPLIFNIQWLFIISSAILERKIRTVYAHFFCTLGEQNEDQAQIRSTMCLKGIEA